MTEIPSWAQTKCACDGGRSLRDDLEPDSAMCTAQAGLFMECDKGCDGGENPCEACEGAGYFSDKEGMPECEACDGNGSTPCEACEGSGGYYHPCDSCDEPIDSESYRDVCYHGDGYIVCDSCAWVDCPKCEGLEIVQLEPPRLEGRTFDPVAASCSCCGSRPHAPGERSGPSVGFWNDPPPDWGWYSFRARMSDTDGVFYSYLCGDETGEEGCLRATLDQQGDIPAETLEGLEMLSDCSGGDDDGLWNDAQDLLGLKTS